MLDFKVKRFVGIIFHLILAQICLAQTGIANQNFGKDTLQLREVVVRATRPLAKLNSEGFVTEVKGTVLEKLGFAKDVMGMLPGVLNNNGSIEVFGKGKPVFYINGHIVRNNIEVEQLKANQIDKITVITNPSSRYASTVGSIIKITTIKKVGDGFSFDNIATFGYRNYLYGKDNLDLNYRIENLDVFGTFGFEKGKNTNSSKNVQNSWLSSHHQQNTTMKSTQHSKLIDGKWGFDFSSSPKLSFGAFYQVSYAPTKTNSSIMSSLYSDDVIESETSAYKDIKLRDLEHLLDGYCHGVWGKWNLEMTFDLMWKKTHENQNVIEQTGINQDFGIKDVGHARLMATELYASHPFLKGNFSFGVDFTNSSREENSESENSIMAGENNKIQELNMAYYVETMQHLGNVTIRIGGRYEYVNSEYFIGGRKNHEQSHVYDKFFPTASLSLPIGKAMVQLSYSKQCYRPLYSQLSNTVHYVNKYLYQSGNPYLQPSYSDNISLNLRYRWLALTANYKKVRNQIITSYTYYDDAKTIALLKKENSRNSLSNLQIMASFMPGFLWKCYYPVLACGVVSQFYKIDYRGNIKHVDNPLVVVKFNNIFKFHNSYMGASA
ncbi:TonB-dependent receptor [Segatella copri]|uniref:TonB-dependent receptor plug domain-containing protein n=1 Tax=Segatella copri TaxID=165179 RepID=UPI00293A6B53|nr:TonB-dependent receptor [Segatella copri]MDV3113687.1 TonB-dependent receptor [Segatella copri]